MKPYYRKPLNGTALLGVLVLVALLVATGAAWAQQNTFECTDTAYVIQGNLTQSWLTEIDQSVDPFVFKRIPNEFTIYPGRINNLAFYNGLLYGWRIATSATLTAGLVSIDALGNLTFTAVVGMPTSASSSSGSNSSNLNAGDVDPTTGILYLTDSGGGAPLGNPNLYAIDLATGAMVGGYPKEIRDASGNRPTGPSNNLKRKVNDFAFKDGLLYGGDQNSGELAILDPATGIRKDVSLSSLPFDPNDQTYRYGGAYFRPDGTLHLYENNVIGGIYPVINPTSATPTLGTFIDGPNSVDVDAASCADATGPEPAIDIEKTVCLGEYNTDCSFGDGSEFVTAMQDEAVTYFFEITNIGDLDLDPVDFSDMDLGIDYTTVGLVFVSDDRDNGSLAPGGKIILAYQTTADENLAPQGSLVNTACTDGTPPEGDNVSDCDPAIVLVPELCADPRDPSDGEGCTPGYWKAKQHYDSWPDPYTPDSNFLAVFGAGPDISFKDALKVRDPRGEGALIRHAVAALLNAASGYVEYEFSETDVIKWVQDAYEAGTYEEYEKAKDHLEMENERMCPLSNDTFK